MLPKSNRPVTTQLVQLKQDLKESHPDLQAYMQGSKLHVVQTDDVREDQSDTKRLQEFKKDIERAIRNNDYEVEIVYIAHLTGKCIAHLEQV